MASLLRVTLASLVLAAAMACSSSSDEGGPASANEPPGTVVDGGALADGATSAPVDAASPKDGAPAAPAFAVGLNVDGLEFAGDKVPGNANQDYAVLNPTLLDYYHSKKIDVVRVPFLWERLQPNLRGPLDATYLGYLTTFVAGAATRGMTVVLDVHDYGGYRGKKIGAGNGAPTAADLADLWTKLATAFVGKPGVLAYDLMNEPSGMPSPAAWPAAAQAAVDAIRKVDTATTIYVEGDFYSSASRWVEVNGTLDVADPSNNIVYSAHNYLDRDSSGTHFAWAEEAANGVTTKTGADRLKPFVGWLQAHGFRGHIGEMGVGNDDPKWNEALDEAIASLQGTKVIGLTYFAAGPWWGTYPQSVEPTTAGHDRRQMEVLTRYSGGTYVP